MNCIFRLKSNHSAVPAHAFTVQASMAVWSAADDPANATNFQVVKQRRKCAATRVWHFFLKHHLLKHE